MAIKGFRACRYAKYNNAAGVVTYSSLGTLAKTVSISVTWNKSDDVKLYGGDSIAEIGKGGVTGADVTLSTTGLTQQNNIDILGVEVKSVAGNSSVEVLHTGTVSPYLGLGYIEWHEREGTESFVAVILPRMFFSIPTDAATTKGESIEWQVPELSGSALQSEQADASGNYPFRYRASFATAAAALAWIDEFFDPGE
jgi:phi13 family phage major tail protein